ncbi:MAG: rRNA maturation RNAse YbeY [Patescibacteria group bacterium]
MKNTISFTNLTKKRIKTAEFLRIYKKLLPEWELSVVFAEPALMRRLNKKYRKKDKTANVLSFKLDKKEGEIFLNAQEKKLLYLFIHACLHLLGFDHKTRKGANEMEQKEKQLGELE